MALTFHEPDRSAAFKESSALSSYFIEERRTKMIARFLGFSTAALMIVSTPVVADPGDYRENYREKRWEKIADCDKKLYEAKDRREFRQKATECNRELAKLDREARREAAKEWREAEKKWRDRHRDYDDDYYDWDD